MRGMIVTRAARSSVVGRNEPVYGWKDRETKTVGQRRGEGLFPDPTRVIALSPSLHCVRAQLLWLLYQRLVR